ncbi:hypothetical protein ACOT81_14385 [Streptomyces sp. WI04-05B]|uniref:hypothetical protein n=1 Tax=Streptomyces TaxID=1883 RepID=UPI0029A23B32|nr:MULTISPECIES: hypothetical protein [unclassified Streptomyces]MDX2540428.1 hypothetical protein [Streptomyces sp. WI04-05B]MDX2585139.1 hypothetical protein [Streptomyces sp. WI04-05A]MDX3749409.1 hypothetical protein [Streptomyces sp. AK08-02]
MSSTTEPVGLLRVAIVYERPAPNKVVCHARCISVGRSVFPGDSVLPEDALPDTGTSPARALRIHREPFGEFTELTPGWSAVVELEAPEGTDLSWVRSDANLRVVPPTTGTERGRAG